MLNFFNIYCNFLHFMLKNVKNQKPKNFYYIFAEKIKNSCLYNKNVISLRLELKIIIYEME